MWKKELSRLSFLTLTIITFRYLRPIGNNKVIVYTHAHLRELVIDLLLFVYDFINRLFIVNIFNKSKQEGSEDRYHSFLKARI